MMDIFACRRAAIMDRLGEHGALVLAAAPENVVGRDTELRYVVDAELFYLTGYTEPDAALVLSPANKQAPFTLFVRPRDASKELWTGARGGVEGARAHFGADDAHPITMLAEHLPALLAASDTVYVRPASGRADVDGAVQRAFARARHVRPRTGQSPHTIIDPGELLDGMRVIKTADEIQLIREAARITCDAFLEALPRVRPGAGEWEIEAAVEFGFRSRAADGPAFPTIAAAGSNATVLHYTENRAVLQADELLLLDAGARYRMYCADITRTVPVSGVFSAAQRELYDLVLGAHRAAIAAVHPGARFDAPHAAAQRALAEGLIHLGHLSGSVDAVIEQETELRRFYPHRTSHWLGLEVHDVGAYATRAGPVLLEENMVLTIEPALYMPDSGIGIRIEDDVVVTASGCEVLTAGVPTGVTEIQALVSGR